ncbi:MAG: hypothetical protein JNJ58_13230 [Chitinophagaceae bacterium]|nr:hypothetical protein [Chitinophagaceae bacterium]
MKKLIVLISLLLTARSTLQAQASWEVFGQNRVQYRTFGWKYYDSTHFRTFYYDYGKSNALYALNIAEQELSHIVYMMGGRLYKKLNIIIYNSFSDYRQTNIGRKSDQINEANGGKLDVVGDNIPIYFNGDHHHLKAQIRKGIAKVIKDNMLFGDDVKDVVKNAIRMNLPEWYTLGYVSYIADEWTPENEARIKDMVRAQKKTNFYDLATQYPGLIGQSFWRYISIHYGENAISNLLYLTRYRKTVNNALETILHKPAKAIYLEWEMSYLEESKPLNATGVDSLHGRTKLTTIRTKPEAQYTQFSVSPTGRELVYIEKKDGEYRVMMQDIRYQKTFEVMSGGLKAAKELADPDYPILSWSASGKKLALLYQKKNQTLLRIFTTGKRVMENHVIRGSKLDRITGMCFMPDENSVAVTAIKKGQSDLYKITIRNSRVEPITQDLFDDRSPSLVINGTNTGILFLSNRNNPYIGEQSKSDDFTQFFNLYLYDPTKGTNLTQLSNTKVPIVYPMQWGNEDIAYLAGEKNQLVRKVVKLEKRQSEGDTFSVHATAPAPGMILKQDYLHSSSQVIEMSREKNEYVFYSTAQKSLEDYDKNYFELNPIQDSPVDTTIKESKDAVAEYLTEFDQDTNGVTFLEDIFLSRNKSGSRYQLFTGAQSAIKPKEYRPTFYTDFIQSSLDNTLLFTRYQPFSYNGGSYQNPPVSGFLTSSLTDVMEDYKFTAGIRLGADLRSLDYFLQFANYRKRTDWGFLYYHHTTKNLYDFRYFDPPYYSPYPVLGRISLDYFQANMTYPFDIRKSVRLQFGVRYDRLRTLSQDKYSIGIPGDNQYWAVSRAEYVFDNTVNPLLNIWKGTRAKFFAEYQYKFNKETKGFYNFGYDGRNYQTLFRNMILASRVAGAFSGGNAKILYFVGGTDNELIQRFDNSTAIDLNQNYAFQALSTNLRGYKPGSWNGNSYFIWNEEIRLPVYQTFFKRPTRSGFIRNLQLVLFADAGSAWKGILPDGDNIQNQHIIKDPNSNVTLFIEKYKYNFGLGYGAGLRTRFLGYFLRSDFAWNIDGRKKPMIHVSLATDF